MTKILMTLSIIGLLDALYLTYERFSNKIPPCSNTVFADCGTVLTSQYSTLFGAPLSLIGVLYYLIIFSLSIAVLRNNATGLKLLFTVSFIGFMMSFYFVFLQLFVIRAICLYCMISAVISTIIFVIAYRIFRTENHP